MCQYTLSFSDKAPARFSNTVSRINRSLSKQSAVAKKMLPHSFEATFLLLKRRDKILEKKIGARGEGYRVLDRGFEAIGMGLDCVEGLEYGCGRDSVEEGDE